MEIIRLTQKLRTFINPTLFGIRNLSNVPNIKSDLEPTLDKAKIEQLKRVSLVNFDNESSLVRLNSAIKFAEALKKVPIENVKPMYTVLENEKLRLRSDKVTEGGDVDLVLQNASQVDDDYFVAPSGNIPWRQNDDSNIAKGPPPTV